MARVPAAERDLRLREGKLTRWDQHLSCIFDLEDWISDAEIDYTFEAAKTLGTDIVSANCTRKSIKRPAPFADKHNMLLAAHSEGAPFDPNIDSMVFADNLEQALASRRTCA